QARLTKTVFCRPREKNTQPPAPPTAATLPNPAGSRLSPGDTTPPVSAKPATTEPPTRRAPAEIFRFLENNLMEVDFSGKVYLKQGTIYSYSGNLTFWVKEKRPGGRP